MNSKQVLMVALFGAVFSGDAAATTVVGSWTVEPDNNGSPYMVTTNSANSMMGKWCSDGSCTWMLVLTNQCPSGGTNVPALINTPNSAAAIELSCIGAAPNLAGYYRWVILDPDRIDRMVQAADQAAIAFAIQGTNFQVSRFGTASFAAAFQLTASNPASFKRKATDEKL